MTLVFRERLDQEDFLDYLVYLVLVATLDPRVTEEYRVTQDHLVLVWKDPWDHRDLMVHLVLLVWVNLVLRVFVVHLANKVSVSVLSQ